MSNKDKCHIQHQLNSGEKRIGQHNLPVDGFCAESKTVYQFHGCYHHCHSCKGFPDDNEILQDTLEKENYFRGLGYNVVTMWECEWIQLRKQSKEIDAFCKEKEIEVTGEDNYRTEAEILKAVVEEKLFGLVECDLEVPANLREYFEEMSPIFKNVDVTREDLSDHMKRFSEGTDHLKSPQRMLIGSMHASKILLFSGLLKWYLEHGLKVTKVYRMFCYQPKAVFRKFGESVSAARREGDTDPDKALLGEMHKLVGNSVYGKTITNKEKHRKVSYVAKSQNASRRVRAKTFISLEQLDQDFYEVTSYKARTTMDVPVVVGFVILQYAKLRMLQFYYDFMDR